MAKTSKSKKTPSPNLKKFHEKVHEIINEKGITQSEFIKKSKFLTKSTGNRIFGFTCAIKPQRDTLYHFFAELDLGLEKRKELLFLLYPEDEIYFEYLSDSDMTGENWKKNSMMLIFGENEDTPRHFHLVMMGFFNIKSGSRVRPIH